MRLVQAIIIVLFLLVSGCHTDVKQPPVVQSIQCPVVQVKQLKKFSLNSLITKYFSSDSDVMLVTEGTVGFDVRKRFYVLGDNSSIYLMKDDQIFYTISSK